MLEKRTGQILAAMAAVAVVSLFICLTFLAEHLYYLFGQTENSQGPDHNVWLIRLTGLVLTAWATGWMAFRYQKRINRQIDQMVGQCNKISLADPLLYSPQQLNLPDLNRLDLAIMVMRNVLVDHLIFYRRFFEAAPDMFLSLSPVEHRIQDANHSFFQKLDLPPGEVIGQKVEKFVALNQGWNNAMGIQVKPMRGLLFTKHGPVKIEARLSWEKRSQGEPWILGARLSDISEREKLIHQLVSKSAALEKALQEARSVEKLKDEFLTTLSHEIKTPMVSLKGFLQLIKDGRAQPEQFGEYLAICWRNLLKLEVQINNLLDLARLSAKGQEDFPLVAVDLGAILRTELENLQVMAADKDVTLSEAPVGAFMVKGIPEKLTQLVDNLLINAVKYNKPKGKVNTGLAQNDGQVVLTISDSGVGIEREQMARIFNRFYRAELSGTGRIEGLGIGLSLVQEIVLLHNGNIEVSSHPGKGTTFTVILEALV